jgi:hypothetical protein
MSNVLRQSLEGHIAAAQATATWIGKAGLYAKGLIDNLYIGKTMRPHLRLGVGICMAAEVPHCSCTDLQPGNK